MVAVVLLLLVLAVTGLSLGLAFALPGHIELLAVIFVANLPLLFASTALAPLSFMPPWLAWLAALNPLSFAIEPIRAVYNGSPNLVHRGAGGPLRLRHHGRLPLGADRPGGTVVPVHPPPLAPKAGLMRKPRPKRRAPKHPGFDWLSRLRAIPMHNPIPGQLVDNRLHLLAS